MKIWKRALPFGIASVMLAAAPLAALAASPEFARSEEEWARLRDDKIEYGELEGLIGEYNITVQTNQLDLNEFKQKYGNTKEDVSQKYRDLAEEIYANVDYPDTDDPTYGYMVPSVLNAEIQAKNLEEQADDNLEDSEIIFLNYKQAEKTLVTVAQSNMISYWQRQIDMEQAMIQKDLAEINLTAAQTQRTLGLTTDVSVLTAQEALMTAERNVESAKAASENVRQKLQVMLGWRFDAAPEIDVIPSSDMARIDLMNPQADKETALENNYTLMINRKKLANAASAATRDSLGRTIADNEQKIGSALVTNYQNVLSARIAYQQAEAVYMLEQQNMQTLERQYRQQLVSQNQYETAQYTLKTKELAVKNADLALFQAMETYDWAVKGLASTS